LIGFAVTTWAPETAILKGIRGRRFGAVNHLDAQMVVADGVCDPMSHDSDVSGVELIGYAVRGSPD
jgi:hypothetical protein